MNKEIVHSGVITGMDGNKIRIHIEQQSACSTCHSRSVCMASDMKGKEVFVENDGGNYQIGETVELLGRTSTGLLAVLLAFVIPFLLILLTLIVLQRVVTSEAVSALISLSLLMPYYLILSLFNKKLDKKLQFYIQKTGNNQMQF